MRMHCSILSARATRVSFAHAQMQVRLIAHQRAPVFARSGLDDNTGTISSDTQAISATEAVPTSSPYPPAGYQMMPYAQAPPEATAYHQDPRFYTPMQQQGRDGQMGYYMAPPPGYYPYAPPAAAREAESSTSAPWFIWVGVGMVAAVVLGKVQEFMRNPKSPQQMMTEMMMKQAMNVMGAKGPGASPFGAAGGMGMPPGFGMPPSPGFGMPPPPSASSPAVDVSATSVKSQDSSASPKKGEKFSSRIGSKESSSSGNPLNPASSSLGGLDVVEPVVKEPSSGASTSAGSKRPSSFSFTDVNLDDAAAKAAASAYEQQQQSGGGGGGSLPGSGDSMMNMMETMLRNPEMQKMLYPYLPEPMRNPDSIEWMLNNPEVKKQMATMFETQNMMSPQMADMMKSMDFNQDKVNAQFNELGLKPEDVISKVMSNPELAQGFSNPKVQAAIIDISQNPMNVMKYQNDPEIMKILNEVTTVFGAGGPPRG